MNVLNTFSGILNRSFPARVSNGNLGIGMEYKLTDLNPGSAWSVHYPTKH
jgi:hypothetical protein